MKKITFILFALIAGTTYAQDGYRATATAPVTAEIISPIQINQVNDLSFGRIIASTDGGNVRVAENGDRTFSNPNLTAPDLDNVPQAASFTITAAENYHYNIYIPATQLSLEGGDDMPVSFTHNMESSGNKGTGKGQELLVGGLLTVNSEQAEGQYTGTVSVSVAYE